MGLSPVFRLNEYLGKLRKSGKRENLCRLVKYRTQRLAGIVKFMTLYCSGTIAIQWGGASEATL